MKSENRRKFDLKTLFKGPDTSKYIGLSVKSVLDSTLLDYSQNINFHIFMTLKYSVKNRVIFIVSLEEKKIIVLISI